MAMATKGLLTLVMMVTLAVGGASAQLPPPPPPVDAPKDTVIITSFPDPLAIDRGTGCITVSGKIKLPDASRVLMPEPNPARYPKQTTNYYFNKVTVTVFINGVKQKTTVSDNPSGNVFNWSDFTNLSAYPVGTVYKITVTAEAQKKVTDYAWTAANGTPTDTYTNYNPVTATFSVTK